MTLTEFLLARITSDEALAQSLPEEYEPRGARGDELYGVDVRGRHVIRVSRRRVLAGCAAKRRIVAAFTWDDLGDEVTDPYEVLANLAIVYADHPDYQQEWMPRAYFTAFEQ